MKWENKKFIDFIQLQRGHDLTREQFIDGPYPVVSSTSIMGYHNQYKADGPGVVIGRSGTLGKAQYINDNYWPHNTTLYVKDYKGNYPRFVYYFLMNFSTDKHGGGSAVPTLNRNTLSSISIRVPDFTTQKRIADILSAYDDLIENNQKQIKLLEEAAMRLYKEWFVKLRFPGYENTKIEDGVPEGWEYKEVGSLISKTPRTKQVKKSEYNNSGEIPIIDQSREFIAGYTDDRETIVDLGVPVIVFGDHTRILKLINFPFAKGADGTQLIVSGVEEMPQHLLYCSLLNIDLSNYHYARHFKYLKASKIIVPTKNISEEFESIVEIYFKVIQILIDKIFLLQKSRDFLLPKLMNGEIEV
jgi:type I restriction enzyme S subunit